jgi:biotin operon repressor
MTPRMRNTGIAVAGAAALAFGAYALGSQSGDGSAVARSAGATASGAPGNAVFVHREGRFGRGGGLGLQGLADKLGVSTTALRDALESVRDELRPKQDPRDEMATKLADALNIPVDKVKSALPDPKPDHTKFSAGLAKALGIDKAKVDAALAKMRDQGHRPDFDALASELGVSTAKLRDALRTLRPDRGERHRRPSLDTLATRLGVTTVQLRNAFDKLRADGEKEFQARRDAFVTALAKKLNLDRAKVEDAIGSFPGPGPGFGPGRRHP